MSNLTDRVSYLMGLAEGLNLNDSTSEGKVLIKMLEMLSEMADEIETLRRDHDELDEYVESIDSDLSDMEEAIFGDDDEDDDDEGCSGCSCECEDCDDCDCDGDCDNCEEDDWRDEDDDDQLELLFDIVNRNGRTIRCDIDIVCNLYAGCRKVTTERETVYKDSFDGRDSVSIYFDKKNIAKTATRIELFCQKW